VDYNTIGHYVVYLLISIPVAFTIFGLGYMIRTNCEICQCCVDLEKEDINLDYGDYYDADGERRQDVMEVQDTNPAYESVNTVNNTGVLAETSFCNQVVENNPDQQNDYDYMGNHDDYDYMGQ